MARQPYVITDSDLQFAYRYVAAKLNDPDDWLGDDTWNARQAFKAVTRDTVTLQAWCAHWLHRQQWLQLKNAIRAARRRTRQPFATRSITLSEEAHKILSFLAKRDKITLSALIVKHLRDEYEEALLADQE